MLNSVQLASRRNKSSDRVKCYVRIRPSSNFAHDNIEILKNQEDNVIQIHDHTQRHTNIPRSANHQQKSWRFHVDDVLYNANQSSVYETVAEKLVMQGLQGYSGTLIAYGESGSGKTFTLSGARDNSDFGQRGLGPRAIGTIFQHIQSEKCRNDEFAISISYLEVQGNKLTDLLVDQQPKKKLEIFEDENNQGATKVDGLSQVNVKNANDAFSMFLKGDSRKDRQAHSIFTIYINSKSHTISGGMIRSAELKFVDLTSWGTTENNKLTGATAPSLTFLEQVVISLQTKCKDSVPWRSCPLTHVLKGSFKRGNSILLTTIFGDKRHLHGSLTTLRFAARINNLPVHPAHVEVSDAESRVQYLETENQKLKDELKMRYILNRTDDSEAPCSNYEPLTVKDIETARKQVQDYLSFKSQKLDGLSVRHINKLFGLMREEYHLKDRQVEDTLRQKYQFIERESSTGEGSNANTPEKGKANAVKEDKKASKDKKSTDKKATGKNKSKESESKTSVQGTDSKGQMDSGTNMLETEVLDKRSSTSVQDNEYFNISEAFDEFKKNNGRVNYMHIREGKKVLDKTKQKMFEMGGQINELVEEIERLKEEVNDFSRNHPETDIITEEECAVRQTLASIKKNYMDLKIEFNGLEAEEIKVEKQLEAHRKQLMIEFSEEYPNQDIFKMTNLEIFNDGRANEHTQPPFSINQQKEQDDPSFNAWQGARTELHRLQQRTNITKNTRVVWS